MFLSIILAFHGIRRPAQGDGTPRQALPLPPSWPDHSASIGTKAAGLYRAALALDTSTRRGRRWVMGRPGSATRCDATLSHLNTLTRKWRLHRLAPSIPSVICATKHQMMNIRNCAFEALGRIGKHRPEVCGALCNGLLDRYCRARQHAAWALARLRCKGSEADLRSALKIEPVRAVCEAIESCPSHLEDLPPSRSYGALDLAWLTTGSMTS
jgi:hypothetical protein